MRKGEHFGVMTCKFMFSKQVTATVIYCDQLCQTINWAKKLCF